MESFAFTASVSVITLVCYECALNLSGVLTCKNQNINMFMVSFWWNILVSKYKVDVAFVCYRGIIFRRYTFLSPLNKQNCVCCSVCKLLSAILLLKHKNMCFNNFAYLSRCALCIVVQKNRDVLCSLFQVQLNTKSHTKESK